MIIESNFKPNLVSQLGEGAQAKVFKAKFHGKDVAMKYIPLDKAKYNYQYEWGSYGCHEFFYQKKFLEYSTRIKFEAGDDLNFFPETSLYYRSKIEISL